ncbi:SANT/Myb_domain [Hexamita inflata]|uniref:SANT/Myb domain n=1 Tax=Hexamita inflata TaxID=28002 RepID=A0AA86UEN7_9EUKA|nr:SANT/Myb domain [Hexamita inflata]
MPYQQKNRWTADEEVLYQFLLKQYHCNFKEVSKHFPSRSYSQLRSHFYNLLRKESASKQNVETNYNYVLFHIFE